MTESCPPSLTALWKSKCVMTMGRPLALSTCLAYAVVSAASFSLVPSKLMALTSPYCSMRVEKWRSKACCEACGLVIWMRCPNVCKPCCSQNTVKVRRERLESDVEEDWTEYTYTGHFHGLGRSCNNSDPCSRGSRSVKEIRQEKLKISSLWKLSNLDKVCSVSIIVNTSSVEPSTRSFPS